MSATTAEYARNYRAAHPELAAYYSARYQERKEAHLEACRRRNQMKTKWVSGFKLMVGCMDCGYRGHPAALEFDHRPGEEKLFCVGSNVAMLSRLWTEMQKCDVVCANCHRVRTANRRAEG
jgi:hypothetical protein